MGNLKMISHFYFYEFKIMSEQEYVLFWGGIFSNWYSCKFIVDGKEYSTSEQYMMEQKALIFNDIKTAEQIMSTNDPRTQKALGRTIKNYDQAIWDALKYEIVKKGCRAKFEQSLFLKRSLLSEKGKTFVEASPEDAIWGVGFHATNALENKNKWGQNLLGKLLTELSNEIQYTDDDLAHLERLNVKDKK